jgi:hypothetical protein
MKQTIKMTALFVMLITALGSCTKGDKGDTGPAGTNGTNGTSGTNGTNGTNGVDGNANVKSGIATVTAGNWGWNATTQVNWVDITDAQITAAIVASGAVSVFFTTNSSQTDWEALPATFWGTPSQTYGYNYYLNGVEITCQNTNLTSLTFNTIYVKIVAIAASLKQSHPHTNWKNYDEVMQVLAESGTNSAN